MISKSGPARIAYSKELKRAKVRERVAKHRKNKPKPPKEKGTKKIAYGNSFLRNTCVFKGYFFEADNKIDNIYKLSTKRPSNILC